MSNQIDAPISHGAGVASGAQRPGYIDAARVPDAIQQHDCTIEADYELPNPMSVLALHVTHAFLAGQKP